VIRWGESPAAAAASAATSAAAEALWDSQEFTRVAQHSNSLPEFIEHAFPSKNSENVDSNILMNHNNNNVFSMSTLAASFQRVVKSLLGDLLANIHAREGQTDSASSSSAIANCEGSPRRARWARDCHPHRALFGRDKSITLLQGTQVFEYFANRVESMK
jgi:hypothetical protein